MWVTDPGYEIRDTSYQIRDAGYGRRDDRGIRHPVWHAN